MSTNHIAISGTTTGSTSSFTSPEYGYCLEFELFTEGWWEDRQGKPHALTLPVRLLNPTDIPPGSSVLVEGRLERWSVGEKLDRRRPAMGILADSVTILAQPDNSGSRRRRVPAQTESVGQHSS